MARIKGQKPLTEDEKQEIIRRYVAGEGLCELAVEYHRNKNTLKPFIIAAGVKLRPRGYPKGTVWHDNWRKAHKAGCNTPEFKEKSRKALLERLPRMRGPAVNTPIERRLHDALQAAGIGFTAQSLLLGRHLVDIELHQAPIVIEADGAQHTLKKRREADTLRDANLKSAGYAVFRFTGSEINTNAARCIEYVVVSCNLVPDEEPRYEINTNFSGPRHPLWKGGMQEFVCDVCGTTFTAHPAHRTGPKTYCTIQCAGAARRGKKLSDEHKANIAAGVKKARTQPRS